MTAAAETPWLSVLLPTRGRPDKANRLLASLAETAARPDLVEVLLYIDEDDPESAAEIRHPGLCVHKHVGPPGLGLGVMTNVLYKASRTPCLLLCGDDNVFRTRGWDTLVREQFARFPDGVALVYGDDLYQGEQICTAPFLTRAYCEITGGPFPPVYKSSYIDTHILNIFAHLEHRGFARRIYLPALVIEHLHHLAGKAEFDATYAARMSSEESNSIYLRLAPLREKHVEALVRHMRQWEKGGGNGV